MHANSVPFSPFAVARARTVTLGAPEARLRRIIDSVRSLKDPDHFSIARLISEEVARKTPSGIVCEKSTRAGLPVPDDVILELARHWFWSRKASRGFLAEGFPSTVGQAIVFDEWLDARDEALTACVHVGQNEEEMVREAEMTLVCPVDGSRYLGGFDEQVVSGLCNICQSALVPAGEDAIREVRTWFRCRAREARALAAYYEERGLLISLEPSATLDASIDRLIARIPELVAYR